MSIADKELIMSSNNKTIAENMQLMHNRADILLECCNAEIAFKGGKIAESFEHLPVSITTIPSDNDGSYDEGYADGKQAENDAFWDTFQQSGKRVVYLYAFARGWSDETFKPKHRIQPTGDAKNMFHVSGVVDGAYTDLLDTSKCQCLTSAFQSSSIRKLKVIDARATTSGYNGMASMFLNCSNLETIDMFYPSTSASDNSTFFGCTALKNLTIGSSIVKSFSFADCPLSVNSMKSVISNLKNYAGTGNEGSYKVTFNTACWTALEASGSSPNGGTWKDYVIEKGWTY